MVAAVPNRQGGWRALWLKAGSRFLVLAALASCQPNQPKEQPAHAPAKPTLPRLPQPVPVPVEPAAPAAVADTPATGSAEPLADSPAEHCLPQPLRFTERLGYHSASLRRYVGTVGGEPVTAVLDWEHPNSLSGFFYLWRRGPEYHLSTVSRQKAKVLAVSEEYPDQARSQWQLTTLSRQVLQGNWVDSTGRRRPVVLREDYRGGVRYEIPTLTLKGGHPSSYNLCDVPEYSQDFLHLLGPAASQRPLSLVQRPRLAERQRLVRAAFNPEGIYSRTLEVQLNDFHLLSYQYYDGGRAFGGTPDNSIYNVLVDLKTGQQLTLASQLWPHYELPLRHLLTGHLLRDPEHAGQPYDYGWEWLYEHGRRVHLVQLPEEEREGYMQEGLALTTQGLEATYLSFAHRTVLIPYRELRPLVRPGTPLARMLVARGLW